MQPSTIMTASQFKTTLTSNPQDSTEIPSLFHTFGHNNISSGEDDDVEILEVNQADEYHTGSYGTVAGASGSGRLGAAGVAYATRVSTVAAYPATAPVLGSRTGITASPNRYPLNRSTRNPYVSLSSTDGMAVCVPEALSSATASNSVTGRAAHRNSFSSSTSQNPLTFEFNSMATAGEANLANNSSSANIGGGVSHRRQPSQQQQQQHLTSQPADGYWCDGSRMSISNTDVRLVATTTVGTLSTGTSGVSQTINVNLRQRVRTPAVSRGGSLSTSQVTMPVVLPAAGAVAAVTGRPVSRPGSTNLSVEAPSLSHSCNTSSVERRPLQQGRGPCTPGSSSNSRNRITTVPCSVMVSSEEVDEHSNASVAGYQSDSPHLQRQRQQQQQFGQYQPHALPVAPLPQQQQQQPYYGYGGPSMPSPHFPYNHSPAGYSDQGYPGVPPHPSAYSPSKPAPHPVQQAQAQVPPPQQRYDPQAPPQRMAITQGAVGEYMSMYSQMPLNTNYYMSGVVAAGTGAAPAGLPLIIQNYSYPVMTGMYPYGHAVPQVGYGGGETRTRHGGGAPWPQPQQQNHSAAGDTPATSTNISATAENINNKSKSTKGKAQGASEGATAALGKVTGNSKISTTTTTMARDGKKLAKKPDEARFHADHSAPIQHFVVVKRKMEGQRYACPLPAAAVPIGSNMLVEGDRGADLGEVLTHISMEQMARDCALVERRRRAALEKMQEQKSGAAAVSSSEDDKKLDAADEGDLPQFSGQEARDYVMSVKDWPWLIGPATPEDVEKLGPQREVEKQAFLTAKPIVQQFIENRYKHRVARDEQATRPAGANAGSAESDSTISAAAAAALRSTQDNASDHGERHTSLTEEELITLELSRQVALVDCEYQFTREKITLFVSRPSRSIFVDFRRMQRRLYRIFRCRIWIAYMDEIADDEDAPESFVFVPPPSLSATAATAAADTGDEGCQEDA